MTARERPRHEFAGYSFDPVSRELRNPAGMPIPMAPKALEVLAYLLENRARIVDKNELLAACWPERVVEENSLSQVISALRKAFGVGRGEHQFILTVPGRGYRFVAELAVASAPVTRTVHTLPTAVAVLPFRALAGNVDHGMLELGLLETLITRLSRSGELRVRSLDSARRVAERVDDPLDAARLLSVQYVVDGTTQRVDDQVRVNVRLLTVADGTPRWADTFDASEADAFRLQDAVADALVLALRVLPPSSRPASPCDGADPVAYRAWLRGYHLSQRPSPERLTEALGAFRHAIDLDTSCARAYAGMALAYRGLVHNDRDPRIMFPLAKAAARQALLIDPGSAAALVAEGRNLHLYDWDWAEAETRFGQAIEINPSLTDAHIAYAHLLVDRGRFVEGLREAEIARELDPLSPMVSSLSAGFLTAAQEPAAAARLLDQVLEAEPGFWIALMIRGDMALDRDDPRSAVTDLTHAAERSQRTSQVLAMLAIAHAAAGERAAAQAILQEMQSRAVQHYVPATSLAAAHLALGQADLALTMLEKAFDERDLRMSFLKVDARWNPLRREPRFEALAKRMGLAGGHAHGRF